MKTFILFILTAFCLNLNAQDNLICKYTMESTINDSLVNGVVVSVTTAFNTQEVYNNRSIGDSLFLYKPLHCREITTILNLGKAELTEIQRIYINIYYILPMTIESAKESISKANRLRKDFCDKLYYNYIETEQKAYKFKD